MATGTDSFGGMGMPIVGNVTLTSETAGDDVLTITGASSQTGDFMVMETSGGTERVWINADGCIYSRGATVTATAYLGLDARGAVDAAATGGWFCTIGGRYTSALVSSEGVQEYALMGRVVHTGTNSGGRVHPLHLAFDITNTVAGTGACSFVYYATNSPTKIPCLFTLGGVTADETGGCFKTATNAIIDHAIKIAVQKPGEAAVHYYIGLYDATSGTA